MPRHREPGSVFGARLVALRKARDLSQIALVDALKKRGIDSSQRAISYYEAEGGNPPLDVLVAIAAILHVSADELLGLAPQRAAASAKDDDPDERRLWRKFQQIRSLPEKDRRAVFRLVNSLTGTKDD